MIDSKFLAKALGLPDTAPESEIAEKFLARLAPAQSQAPATGPTLEQIQKAIKDSTDPLLNKISTLESRASQDAKVIEKAEKKTLVDQACREGKVVPLTDAEIYGEGDKTGIPVDLLKSMVAKLGKSIPINSPARFKVKDVEKGVEEMTVEERKEICKAAKQTAATEIGRMMKSDPNARFLPAQN